VRVFLGYAFVVFSIVPPSGAPAQKLPPPQDAEMPIAFTSAVTDVCFGVGYRNAISPATELILDPLSQAPSELNGMYPLVKTWYRLKKERRNLFVGVGDKPNVCHVVLTNSKDGRQSFNALATLLRSAGFSGAWDARGSAVLIMTKKWGAGNLIVLLRGLTDATDGVGPQVSVDVGSESDEKLRELLGGK
jgi:hypothetical protein